MAVRVKADCAANLLEHSCGHCHVHPFYLSIARCTQARMSRFQCLRTLVAELNPREDRLFLANAIMPTGHPKCQSRSLSLVITPVRPRCRSSPMGRKAQMRERSLARSARPWRIARVLALSHGSWDNGGDTVQT